MSDLPRAFLAQIEKQDAETRRRAAAPVEFYGARRCRATPTEALKALWDSYDGAETSDPEVSGEAVHAELSIRGEGDYCRI